MTTTSHGWVRPGPGVAPQGRPARPRLVCLTYAGRGASGFAEWPRLLGDTADVLAVQLPAREERRTDPPVTDIDALRGQLLPELLPWLDGPFVLFGHCMGGLLAASLVTTLVAQHDREPAALVLSGTAPPWQQDALGDLAAMTDGEFIRGLRKAGALTPKQIAEPAVLALMLPAIRADYLLFESTREVFGEPAAPPLRCPLELFAGESDTAIDPDAMRAWGALTSGPVALRVFPGDHFFLDTAAADVAGAVAGIVREVCP
ncbi:thioesterase II family protein [Labedaea rhizosphaerae]|uniref:Medium-chain acyl-[acyl-carrier-protein] hydrolase n=1 Tax=Labedaea rhizosphaerae TaxID=598644 RepID=A0A4R6S0P5_LABRH|nr:alpha/beta fold hydrolase [Labedaea rhizosphaerae]TDP93020.1 medium-chain acyl-[acyl-carrier-protein] hydrolase [Labedaea rhizosphaerae]